MRETAEELALVKKHIIFPFLMSTVENDKKKIACSNVKMKSVYLQYLDNLQAKISLDMYQCKKNLKDNKIIIIEQTKSDLGLIVKYSNKEYKHKMDLHWSKVKVDVTLLLTDYMKVDITELI